MPCDDLHSYGTFKSFNIDIHVNAETKKYKCFKCANYTANHCHEHSNSGSESHTKVISDTCYIKIVQIFRPFVWGSFFFNLPLSSLVVLDCAWKYNVLSVGYSSYITIIYILFNIQL